MGFTNPYPASRLTVDSTNSLVTGMQAWFPLTEGTGTSAQCILHPSHIGTLNGGVSWENGERGVVASFDGVDDFIETNSNSTVTSFPITVSAWVKSGGSSRDVIFGSYWANGTNRSLQCEIDASGRMYMLCSSTGSYQSSNSVRGTTTLSTTEYSHVVFVFEASGGTLYLNGEVESSSGSLFSTLNTPVVNFLIGAEGVSSNRSHHFDGNISNVQVWDRAITATEVTTLYHRPWEGSNYGNLWPYSPPASTAMTLSTDTAATSIMADIEGWWVMTDGSGTTLTDISGNGRDATLYGTNTWVSDSLGTANRFDNSSSDGNNARTADTQPDLSSGYTVAFWIKHEELGAGTNRYGGGLALTDGAGTGTWWQTISSDIEIYFNSFFANSQHPQVVHNRANGGTHSSYNRNDGTKANQNNVWHFWVVTFDGTNARAYQDASLVGTSGTLTAPLSTTGKHIVINGPADAATGLTCSMQNVRLYSRCLSADEVTLLYERPWEGIQYGDTFHYDPPAPASMLPLTSDAINTDQELWLPLTDGSSTTAVDISGGGNDATLLSAAGWATSSLGTVLALDGQTNSYATTPLLSSSVSHPHTHSIWFRTSDTSGYIIHQLAGTSGIFLRMNSSTLEAYAGTTVALGSANQFNDNQWHNVVAVFNDTSSAFYVDGVLISSSNPGTRGWAGSTIGARSNGAQTLTSDLQNYRVWSRALTADEVWSIYATNPWLGSNYKLASGSTPLYNYIFRTERFRRLG